MIKTFATNKDDSPTPPDKDYNTTDDAFMLFLILILLLLSGIDI